MQNLNNLIKKICFIKSNNAKIISIIVYINKKRLLYKKLFKNGSISKIIHFNYSSNIKIFKNYYHDNNRFIYPLP